MDEAHNLVDRAREMFSADLDSQEIVTVRRAVQPAAPRCAKALAKLNICDAETCRSAGRGDGDGRVSDRSDELNLFPTQSPSADKASAASEGQRMFVARDGKSGVRTSGELPRALIASLESALAEMEAWLVLNRPASFREDLLALYFRLRSFQRTAELYDEHYVTIVENDPAAKVRLFCLNPATLLRQALTRGSAAIFFSATLTPIDYYVTLLGGEAGDPVLQLTSPFPPENLAVLIEDRIQTHFKGRAESIGDSGGGHRNIGAGTPRQLSHLFPLLPISQCRAARISKQLSVGPGMSSDPA